MQIRKILTIAGLAIPGFAFAAPFAEIGFNAYASDSTGWFANYNPFAYTGFPSVQGTDVSLLGQNAANASADLSSGTISAFGGFTINAQGNPDYLGAATAALVDQVTFSGFSGTKVVTFGVAGSYNISGNQMSREFVTDELLVGGATVAQQTVQSGNKYSGNSGSTTYNSWQNDLTYSFSVTSGSSFAIEVLGGASVAPLSTTGNLQAEGQAAFDPNWYLMTPSGVKYTTSSGFSLPGSPVPEPCTLVVLGLPAAAFRLMRRKARPA